MIKRWTVEENDLIKLLRHQGLTYKQMVPYFPDRNLRTIAVQANKLLPPSKELKPWTPEEEELLVELRAKNVPYKQIAEQLGRTYIGTKAKGSQLITSDKARVETRPRKSFEQRKEEALSDLTPEERVCIETGQEFFRF